ncbi:hypothetical protein IEQ34_003565 [Dendrobium chrysotoxum]|uniref:Uncharacterized protein n=1 Tax=Dendrobium chrysotoxum TaxID=161865 RepID=A0AAV7HJJ0_DENCH|nr:hypothetical protein IEQ34_003565 [Dendrobium chrysotoxum]
MSAGRLAEMNSFVPGVISQIILYEQYESTVSPCTIYISYSMICIKFDNCSSVLVLDGALIELIVLKKLIYPFAVRGFEERRGFVREKFLERSRGLREEGDGWTTSSCGGMSPKDALGPRAHWDNAVLHSHGIGGANPVYQSMEYFNNNILDCHLIDIGYSRNEFSLNYVWIRFFLKIDGLTPLIKTLFDHPPPPPPPPPRLLISVKNVHNAPPPNLRIQNMWLLDDSFLNMIQHSLDAPLHPDNPFQGMNIFWFKLQRLKF